MQCSCSLSNGALDGCSALQDFGFKSELNLVGCFEGTLQDMKARHQKHVSATSSDSTCFSIKHPSELNQPISEATSDTLSCDETGNAESDEDFFQPEENKPCTFAEVFSDTEEEEEEEEEDNKGHVIILNYVKSLSPDFCLRENS